VISVSRSSIKEMDGIGVIVHVKPLTYQWAAWWFLAVNLHVASCAH
jgi:hypothetical protein